MHLPVPDLAEAQVGSFPLAPDEVAAWLAQLDPLDNDSDARELLRGLTHSNRLANSLERRRTNLAHFVPLLRSVHERLIASTRAQPLPLTHDFARDAALADALLREESVAFRLLLNDSEVPREVDARRSMQALLRRGELAVHSYRQIPADVWRDAHALYRFAAAHELAADTAIESDEEAAASQDLGRHYRLLLLLYIMQPNRMRARQLPLLVEWLRERAHRLVISPVLDSPVGTVNPDTHWPDTCWLVDFGRGTVPTPAGSLLLRDVSETGIIDVHFLQQESERRADEMRVTRASLLGADTLERQSLARLALSLKTTDTRRRKHARRRSARAMDCVFSHKYITARLLYENELTSDEGVSDASHARTHASADQSNDSSNESSPPAHTNGDSWILVDQSPGGCRIEHANAQPGSVQVGELVSLHGPSARPVNAPGAARRDILLGVVRHLQAGEDGSLSVGIGSMASAVMPVIVTRLEEAEAAPENAMVIAFRSGEKPIQTIIVPPFLYQSGDRLLAAQGDRVSRVELSRCLQLNGLFSQYELKQLTDRA